MTRAIQFAYKFACRSDCEHYRHSAIVFKKGRFICGAANIQKKTHTLGSGPHTSCHAEVRAIIKAKAILNRNNLSDCTIFVMRINKRGEIKLSKPCKDCAKLITVHGLKAEWTIGNEENYEAGNLS